MTSKQTYKSLNKFYDGIYSYNEYTVVKSFFDNPASRDVLDNCLSGQWTELLKEKYLSKFNPLRNCSG